MNFFSKYRVLIVVIGVLLGAACLTVANFLIDGSLPQDFLVNISAGAITISLTVVLVDFFVNREHTLNNKDALELASYELHVAAVLILVPMAKLYKVKLTGAPKLEDAAPQILKNLEKIDMKARESQAKENLTKDFLYAVDKAALSLNGVQQQYAYALPDNVRGMVLKLYKRCIQLNSLISQLAEDGAINSGVIRQFYVGLFGDTRKLVQYTLKLNH